MGVSRGARLCVLGLALAAAAAAGAFPIAYADDAPPIPPGTVGIRLLEAPASRLDDPRALNYVVDHVHPGASFARSIQVSNGIDGPIRFGMLAGAATIGGYGWSAQPFAANELTSWITLDPAHLTVPPGGSQVVVARFAVPQDASAGERFAALFAVTAPSAGDGNVQTRSAVGIRVYLDVGRGGEPASSFTATDLRAQAGAILAAVTNTGERALDVAGRLTLEDGPGGASAGPFDGQAVTLAVGASGTVVVPVPSALPRGPWHARLVLRSGRVSQTLEATLTFPAIGRPPVRVTPERHHVPVAVPAGLGALALGLALHLARRRLIRRLARLASGAWIQV
jgi:hypothetical protein